MLSSDNLWSILWGDGGQYHEVRLAGQTTWVACERGDILARLLRADDCEVSMVPRTDKHPFALGRAWVLWARLEAPECARRLECLRVGPTLVAREGASSRRTVLWALSEPLDGPWITRATERLSWALKGRRSAADASALVLSPFTRVTVRRKKPQRVWIEYQSDSYATARQIVGALADAPAADGWKAAA